MKAFKEYREAIFDRFREFGGFYDDLHKTSTDGIETNSGGVDELGEIVSDSSGATDELASILSDLTAAIDELGKTVSALSEKEGK